jgi:hypothetical protein
MWCAEYTEIKGSVNVPIFQLLMMALLVRKSRSCKAGWVNAGFTRRATTKMWAAGFLFQNGSLGEKSGKPAITSQDLIPAGLEHATSNDTGRLYEQLGSWLDYWSNRYPNDTLEQAMVNLIVRLVKAKEGWIAERGNEPFPFDQAIASVVAGRLEPYINGKV